MSKDIKEFKYKIEQFADIQILRYLIPGFHELSLKQKTLAYYLYEAALSGRDIFYDQNYKYNLIIRRTLEAIVNSYTGDENSEEWKNFIIYSKRVWFSNGIHHHYSTKKILPDFTIKYFESLLYNSDKILFPFEENQTIKEFLKLLVPVIFDPKIDSQKVVLESDADVIKSSAVNFYKTKLKNIIKKELTTKTLNPYPRD